jgi:hypothetical protein
MRTERTDDCFRYMIDCFLCRQSFQFGPHRYDGKGIGAWKISVCLPCYNGNWDGLVPEQHPKLMQNLKDLGLEPALNSRGWLSWPE